VTLNRLRRCAVSGSLRSLHDLLQAVPIARLQAGGRYFGGGDRAEEWWSTISHSLPRFL